MAVGYFLLGLSVYPVYMEKFKVDSALKSMRTDPNVQGKSAPEVTEMLLRRLRVDNVDDIQKSDITVERAGSGVRVAVDYVIEKNLFDDISISAHIEKDVLVEAK